LGPTEQRREVVITVINEAGTPDETSVTFSPFTFELQVLTPVPFSVSPSSGPNDGNTRITIFGEGFQSPVRVFFGTGGTAQGLTDEVELEVQQVTYDRIIAVTPPALGLGASLANIQVTMRVYNVASNTGSVLPLAFRYGPGMAITAVSPTQGPASGGTRVTIFGWGFEEPLFVTIGGVPAVVTRISGSEISAVTGAPLIQGCPDSITGPIVVTSAVLTTPVTAAQSFIYLVEKPEITAVSPASADPGSPVQVTVIKPGSGTVRIKIGDFTLTPTSSTTLSSGAVRYTVVLPSDIEFPTEPCGLDDAGTRSVPITADVVFTNVSTGCSDTLEGGFVIEPSSTACVVPPMAAVSPESVDFGSVTATTTANQAVSVSNTGGGTVTVSGATSSNAAFTVTGATFPKSLSAGSSQSYNIAFTPPATGPYSGTITFQTSAGNVTVAVTGSAP
ncbi:MAG TPA: choice-of-anchor D domain-containing protein, partial [Thermoanaerobaculia bacterium]|nr:choice-of-anchor D domain-containing protein [Thermoanaerobaculia bacterium]